MRIQTVRAWVFATIAAPGGGATLLAIRTSPASLPLPHGGELRVVDVAVGTNHFFRRTTLEKIAPLFLAGSLGKATGQIRGPRGQGHQRDALGLAV